jgi:hypothetical protein
MTQQKKPDSLALTHSLMSPIEAPRYAVNLEDRRVTELLAEPAPIDPYAQMPRFKQIGRHALEGMGLLQKLQPHVPERPHLSESQADYEQGAEDELNETRELLKMHTTETDGMAIDMFLGIYGDKVENSILPNSLKIAFDQTRNALDEDISFITWLAEHATNEQLLNVLQWHDIYLQDLDNSDAFKQRVENVKAEFSRGLDQAVKKGLLHPSLLESTEVVRHIPVKHSSPLSPIIAAANAYINHPITEVHVRQDPDTFTFYHEFTHLLGEGFVSELDEGRTDLIAKAIYDQVSDTPTPKHQLSYDTQITTLEMMNEFSNGELDLFKLSELSAGLDQETNTQLLFNVIDSHLGYPLTEAVIRTLRNLFPEDTFSRNLNIQQTLRIFFDLIDNPNST